MDAPLPAAVTFLAHEGRFSWDELLYLVIPAAVVLLVVRSARRRRRVSRAAADMLEGPPETKS